VKVVCLAIAVLGRRTAAPSANINHETITTIMAKQTGLALPILLLL